MRGLLLFDIDGTLLKPGDKAHQLAFIHAMRAVYGLEASLEGVPLAGMLDSQIARLSLGRHGLSDDEIDARLAELSVVMGEHYAVDAARVSRVERVLPGVNALLEHLRDERYALGVLTGNVRAVAHAKLASAEIADYFPVGAFGDSARERGHLVEAALADAERHYHVRFAPERTLLIGDTPRDIEAAHFGAAKVIAVATGRHPVEELQRHQPEAVFADLSDTEAVLAAIHRILPPGEPRMPA